MESGDRVRMKTAISSFSGGFSPPPVRLRANALTSPTPPQGGSVSLVCSGLNTESRGGVLMDLRKTKKMEIIQFPENIDKLTGFFDKYLKSNAGENETIIGFISNSYAVIFKQKKNILSNFIE